MRQHHLSPAAIIVRLGFIALCGAVACDADFAPRGVEDIASDRELEPEVLDGSSGGTDVGPLPGGDDGSCTELGCDGCRFDESLVGDDEICVAEPTVDDVPGGSDGGAPDADAEPWGTSGIGIDGDDDFDLVPALDPSADKKGSNCYPAFPDGCKQLNGTKILGVRWMEQFRQATASNPWVNAPLTFNQLTDEQVDQIISNCKNKPTELEKLVCDAVAVDVAVDGLDDKSGDYVCRHHMGSLYKVLKKMGYGNTATGSITHAWNEVEIDTDGDGVKDTIVVLDSYNGIYYTVPKK